MAVHSQVSGLRPSTMAESVAERKSLTLRIHRFLPKASIETLLEVEALLKARGGTEETHNRNPSGSTGRVPNCKLCGGLRPPAEGAEPWRSDGAGRLCLPCRWSGEAEEPREKWPHWEAVRQGTLTHRGTKRQRS